MENSFLSLHGRLSSTGSISEVSSQTVSIFKYPSQGKPCAIRTIKPVDQETLMNIYSILNTYTQAVQNRSIAKLYRQVLEDAHLINDAFPDPPKKVREMCKTLKDYILLKKKYLFIGQDSSNFDHVIQFLLGQFRQNLRISPTYITVKKVFKMYAASEYIDFNSFQSFCESFFKNICPEDLCLFKGKFDQAYQATDQQGMRLKEFRQSLIRIICLLIEENYFKELRRKQV